MKSFDTVSWSIRCVLILPYWLQKLCAKISKHILIWVEEQTYWIASRFLILGFELELYSPSEYCMVYWYIYVVLIKLAEKTHLKMLTSSETGECCFGNMRFASSE